MTFSSLVFLCIFLPTVFLLHWVLPSVRLQNALLILASLLFYAFGEPVYVLLMIVCAFFNYLFALLLGRKKSKAAVTVAVIANLGMLGVFKYAGFVVESLNRIPGLSLPVPQIALPIGISFFTFQALSYVIDVHRGRVPAQRSFWRILLCFSPLKFSKTQADKILDNQEGSAELVEKMKKQEATIAELTRKNEQLAAEAERLRAKQAADSSEIQELKRQNRQLRADGDQLQLRLDSMQAENRHISQQVSEANDKQQEFEKQLRDETQRTVARIQNELDRVTKELQTWQSRYEEQKFANRQLEEGRTAADKARDQVMAEKAELEKELSESQDFADTILSRIDWPHVGAAMKITPTVRKNLNSLLKKLNYEEDRTLTIEGTLPEFWSSLAAGDAALIKKLANSSMEELASGDINGYWQEVGNQFKDVLQNLEARQALLTILQDLFFQTLEMSDLDVSKIPSKSKAKKKE